LTHWIRSARDWLDDGDGGGGLFSEILRTGYEHLSNAWGSFKNFLGDAWDSISDGFVSFFMGKPPTGNVTNDMNPESGGGAPGGEDGPEPDPVIEGRQLHGQAPKRSPMPHHSAGKLSHPLAIMDQHSQQRFVQAARSYWNTGDRRPRVADAQGIDGEGWFGAGAQGNDAIRGASDGDSEHPGEAQWDIDSGDDAFAKLMSSHTGAFAKASYRSSAPRSAGPGSGVPGDFVGERAWANALPQQQALMTGVEIE
jgi:hypothetical protein